MAMLIWLKQYNKITIKKKYVPGYINKPSLFIKIKSKWPLLGGSHFNIYFHTEQRENRGSNQYFHEISFSEDYSLINYHMLV